MIKHRHQLTLKIFQISDLGFLLLSFLAARCAVNWPEVEILSLDQFLSMRFTVQNFIFFGLSILAWHAVFVACGLYRSGPVSRSWGEFAVVIRATCIGALLLIGMDKLFFGTGLLSPLLPAVFLVIANATISLNRILLRHIYVLVRMNGRHLRHILIVGTNRRAIRFARNIEDRPHLGYYIVGFVENGWTDNRDFRQTEYRKVTDFDGLPDFLRKNIVDEVMICLPIKSFYKLYSEIVTMCEEQGIVVRLLSDFFDLKTARATTACQEDDALSCQHKDTLVTIEARTMKGWTMGVKRAMDIAVSFVLLSLLSPLMLAWALMRAATASPGGHGRAAALATLPLLPLALGLPPGGLFLLPAAPLGLTPFLLGPPGCKKRLLLLSVLGLEKVRLDLLFVGEEVAQAHANVGESAARADQLHHPRADGGLPTLGDGRHARRVREDHPGERHPLRRAGDGVLDDEDVEIRLVLEAVPFQAETRERLLDDLRENRGVPLPQLLRLVEGDDAVAEDLRAAFHRGRVYQRPLRARRRRRTPEAAARACPARARRRGARPRPRGAAPSAPR